MEKVPLEIIIPIYNEGEKVIKLLEQFQIIIKIQFRVLLCYDLEDDNIFNYKDSFKKFNFKVVKNFSDNHSIVLYLTRSSSKIKKFFKKDKIINYNYK